MASGSPRHVLLNERRRVAVVTRVVLVTGIAAIAIGAIVTFFPRDTSDVVPTVLLLLIVLSASIAGGAPSGIIAAALATIGLKWSFIPVVDSLEPKTASDAIATGLFGVAALAVALAVRRFEVAHRRVTDEKVRRDVLDDLSAAMATTLDPDTAVNRAVEVLVPTLADSCTVDLLREDGTFRRVAAVDDRPWVGRFIAQLKQIAPSAPAHPSVRAVESGSVVVIRRVRDANLRDMAGSERHLHVLRKLHPVSILTVPLVHREQTLGALQLAHNKRTRRRFSFDDAPLVLEVAARLARAVRNAQVFEVERRSVAVLQRTLLPEDFPRIDRVHLDRLYRPAAAEVGGDWYAAVPLPPRGVGLAVGDVAGHGVEAATVMANVRFALKAVAFDGAKPSEVLERLNQMMHHYENDTFVTACYGVLDLDAMLWQQALAGHVPPVLARDGSATLLESQPGPPLGVTIDAGYSDESFGVDLGSTLLLYSDGLVERRGESLADGLARLCATVSSGNARDVEAIAAHLADPSNDDDVIVLAATILR